MILSYEQVYFILSHFSKLLLKADPESLKDFLHSIINKITLNASTDINKRSVKDIELFFDASHKDNYVFTYVTVHRNIPK